MSARMSTLAGSFVRRTSVRFAACVALASIFAAGTASADSITFDITDGNLSGYSGPYALVTVKLTSSTTATISFTSLNDGTYLYLMGDGGSAAVNVNATSFTVSDISGVNYSVPAFTPGPYTTSS